MNKDRRKKKVKYIPVQVFYPAEYQAKDLSPPAEYQVGDLCEVDNIPPNHSLGSGNSDPEYSNKELVLLIEVKPENYELKHKFLRLKTQSSGWWNHKMVHRHLKLFASNS